MVSSADQAEAAVRAQTDALRTYLGTEPFDHLIALLDALKVVYMHDLADVMPDGLRGKQGALRQVMAMHRALTSELVDTPRI